MTKYKQIERGTEKYNYPRNPYNKRVIGIMITTKDATEKVTKKVNYSQEQIEKELGNNMVKTRITYLRHFPYDNSKKEVKEYNELLEDLRKQTITPEGKERIKELSPLVDRLICEDINAMREGNYIPKEALQKLFHNPEKTLIVYYDSETGMQRCRITGEKLAKIFQVQNIKHVNLPGSDKDVPTGTAYATKPYEISEVLTELEILNQKEKYENIIIIGNRSYAHGFNLLGSNRYTSVEESIQRFESEFYDDIDYNSGNQRLNREGLLKVSLENYQKLQEIFPEIEHKGIIDFQNKLNVYFKKNPVLYKKYVFSLNEDLRVFCIVNLITKGMFQVVHENLDILLNTQGNKNPSHIAKIILDVSNDDQKRMVLNYIASVPNLLSHLDLGSLEYYANYQKYVVKNILALRQKTLDDKLKVGEVNIVSLGFSDESIKTIVDLIHQNEMILIEGESGSGKSIKLLEIMEYLKPKDDKKNTYFPIYIHLGEILPQNIKGEIERQQTGLFGKEKYQFVYLFDALDESKYDDETKKEFFRYIKELQNEGGKVIVTSRPGNKPQYDENEKEDENIYESLKRIQLKKFSKTDIADYIETHLSEDKIKIWNYWVENNNFIHGIEDSPLILSILCNLLDSGEDIKSIKTKTDLYEKIVENRLLNWEKLRNKTETTKTKLKKREKLLSEIAYYSLIKLEEISEKFLEKLIKSNERYEDILPIIYENGEENYDFEPLNFIFKNNEEFVFIHESFREYFAVRYIFEEVKNNNEKFDFEQFLCQDLKKVDINFLEMLCELLKTDDNAKEIFLRRIDENESYFSPEIHYKIVYILLCLDEEKMHNYLEYVLLNEKIINILIDNNKDKKYFNSISEFYLKNNSQIQFSIEQDSIFRYLLLNSNNKIETLNKIFRLTSLLDEQIITIKDLTEKEIIDFKLYIFGNLENFKKELEFLCSVNESFLYTINIVFDSFNIDELKALRSLLFKEIQMKSVFHDRLTIYMALHILVNSNNKIDPKENLKYFHSINLDKDGYIQLSKIIYINSNNYERNILINYLSENFPISQNVKFYLYIKDKVAFEEYILALIKNKEYEIMKLSKTIEIDDIISDGELTYYFELEDIFLTYTKQYGFNLDLYKKIGIRFDEKIFKEIIGGKDFNKNISEVLSNYTLNKENIIESIRKGTIIYTQYLFVNLRKIGIDFSIEEIDANFGVKILLETDVNLVNFFTDFTYQEIVDFFGDLVYSNIGLRNRFYSYIDKLEPIKKLDFIRYIFSHNKKLSFHLLLNNFFTDTIQFLFIHGNKNDVEAVLGYIGYEGEYIGEVVIHAINLGKMELLEKISENIPEKKIEKLFERLLFSNNYLGHKICKIENLLYFIKLLQDNPNINKHYLLEAKVLYLNIISAHGGKNNIELIQQYYFKNEKYIKTSCFEILERIGGKENLTFIQQHKHLLEN